MRDEYDQAVIDDLNYQIETLTNLAHSLRGEIKYMHDTYDVSDSIKNSGTLLQRAEEMLGPIEEN